MKRVGFVTTNKGKLESIRRTCAEHGVGVDHIFMEVPEPQTTDLELIAKEKSAHAFRMIQQPIICQDSGFYLEAFPGFPGPFVKFTLKTLCIEGYQALCKDRSRRCWFEECIAFNDTSCERIFTSKIFGNFAPEERGALPPTAWSKLWLVFIPDGCTKTIAEMSEGERAVWRTMRGNNSAQLFAKWFASAYKK